MRKETALKGRIVLAAALFVLLISGECLGNGVVLKEASGVTRLGDELLIVGDEAPGGYYRFKLNGQEGKEIPIDPSRVIRVQFPRGCLALDLESIGVLADERVVVLSERLRSLVGEKGVIAEYGNPLAELGNRGLEGLAVRGLEDGSSRIAVLWEGGYPVCKDLPKQLQGQICGHAMHPVVWIHDIKPYAKAGWIGEEDALWLIDLSVPEPAGLEPEAQRFRAPDLVWHNLGKGDWGFIVLLSSENSPRCGKPKYLYKWLQRFTVEGNPYGEPLHLNAIVPENLKDANWEGLGWFEEGKSLVIIHDSPPAGQPTAFVVDLPESWRTHEAR
jgi:hypothetical protein